MEWIDSHVHLTDERFAEDLPEVLERAREAGVVQMLLIAFDLPSSEAVVALAREHEELYCAVGVHPHDADSWTPELERRLRSLLDAKKENKIVAVGEIGLDYYYDNSPREIQKLVFRRQLELAKEYELPFVIHNREAHHDTYDILEAARRDGLLREADPGVMHCYSGSPEMALRFLKLGLLLGYDGPITFKNAKQPCECVAVTPRDRLLIETDCPYLTPVPHRGKRNEPSYVPLVGAKVAEIWGCDPEEAARQTVANTRRLFGLPG